MHIHKKLVWTLSVYRIFKSFKKGSLRVQNSLLTHLGRLTFALKGGFHKIYNYSIGIPATFKPCTVPRSVVDYSHNSVKGSYGNEKP